ncbi:MAG: 1-acyl-sn-glycerol-3-phosphate acyltransferase [Candidatus Geothermincolia bacterium]
METAVIDRAPAEEKWGFRHAAGAVGSSFAWRPDPFARILVGLLSRVMRPLEQGSYEGRPLSGEPHRASWVIASPLNVFVVPKAGYWRKIVLAARLRHKGEINVVETGTEPGHAASVLSEVIEIQRDCDVSLRLIAVARTSHQLSKGAANVSVAARAYRVTPQSLLRRTTSLFRTVRTGRVKNCKPLILATWLESRDGGSDLEEASALRIELMGNIESQHRACEGPPAMPAWEVKRRVLADPLLASYMQDYALREGMSRDSVADEARGFMDEIASDYRVGVVRWFARAVDFMFDRFLTDIEVDRAGIRFLSECDSRSRLVLVCSHKSYVDPLLIGYTLFRSGMVPPQQAAGLNLNFWPVGWLLRHSGAFYLRRTFAGETLYREVFSAYVRYLLAENHIIVVYIEGTRSRDGKLAKPKTGFMGILEDSLNMGICQDIKLVPVYLGYDKTPEESAHVKEMTGGRKVSESVKGFGRIYKSINTRLGRAYVKFGRPMSMKGLLGEHGLEKACEAACEGINSVTPVTARGVAASALLAGGNGWVSSEDVSRSAELLLRFAERRGCPLAVDADVDGVMDAVEWLAGEGHVARDTVDEREGFKVDANGRRFLEYNKNLPLGHFLQASFEALARRGCAGDAAGNGREEDTLVFLEQLLTEEFVFTPAASPGDALGDASPEDAAVFASLLESYVEGYTVAARSMGSIGDDAVTREDLIEQCMREGEIMLADGTIVRPESVSKIMMVNALRKFVDREMLAQTREKVEGQRDRVTLTRGPRFEEMARIEERLRALA